MHTELVLEVKYTIFWPDFLNVNSLAQQKYLLENFAQIKWHKTLNYFLQIFPKIGKKGLNCETVQEKKCCATSEKCCAAARLNGVT